MDLLKNLNWRYATKKYLNKKVNNDDLEQLVEAINLTASSCGLQPYHLYVISNPDIKESLSEGSFNSQIVHSSHLLVFASLKQVSDEYIEKYVEMTEHQREVPKGTFDDFKNTLLSYFSTKTDSENASWAAKQAYIALGTALIAAAELKIDATPMEGFDPDVFDKVLRLNQKGLQASVIMSIGYRDEEGDFLANMKKVRFSINEFVTKIS